MPLNSEAPSTHLRHEFCLALKAARERRGITLGEIADTTKISASHFAELERSDLRHWPKGLFRRSFFRDYARTIGVPEAEACAEFARLFPEDEGAKPAEPPASTPDQKKRQAVLDAARLATAAMATAWRRGARALAHIFASDKDGKSQAGDEPGSRAWVSDARRVGAPRLRVRVRIKLPH